MKKKSNLNLDVFPTSGGSGTGNAMRDGALFSLAYHQSKNCRKNTPTDRLVDRVTAVRLRAFLVTRFSFPGKL